MAHAGGSEPGVCATNLSQPTLLFLRKGLPRRFLCFRSWRIISDPMFDTSDVGGRLADRMAVEAGSRRSDASGVSHNPTLTRYKTEIDAWLAANATLAPAATTPIQQQSQDSQQTSQEQPERLPGPVPALALNPPDWSLQLAQRYITATAVPPSYFCPLARCVMREPVRDRRDPERVYERSAITAFVRQYGCNPVTGQPMCLAHLGRAAFEEDAILEWVAEHTTTTTTTWWGGGGRGEGGSSGNGQQQAAAAAAEQEQVQAGGQPPAAVGGVAREAASAPVAPALPVCGGGGGGGGGSINNVVAALTPPGSGSGAAAAAAGGGGAAGGAAAASAAAAAAAAAGSVDASLIPLNPTRPCKDPLNPPLVGPSTPLSLSRRRARKWFGEGCKGRTLRVRVVSDCLLQPGEHSAQLCYARPQRRFLLPGLSRVAEGCHHLGWSCVAGGALLVLYLRTPGEQQRRVAAEEEQGAVREREQRVQQVAGAGGAGSGVAAAAAAAAPAAVPAAAQGPAAAVLAPRLSGAAAAVKAAGMTAAAAVAAAAPPGVVAAAPAAAVAAAPAGGMSGAAAAPAAAPAAPAAAASHAGPSSQGGAGQQQQQPQPQQQLGLVVGGQEQQQQQLADAAAPTQHAAAGRSSGTGGHGGAGGSGGRAGGSGVEGRGAGADAAAGADAGADADADAAAGAGSWDIPLSPMQPCKDQLRPPLVKTTSCYLSINRAKEWFGSSDAAAAEDIRTKVVLDGAVQPEEHTTSLKLYPSRRSCFVIGLGRRFKVNYLLGWSCTPGGVLVAHLRSPAAQRGVEEGATEAAPVSRQQQLPATGGGGASEPPAGQQQPGGAAPREATDAAAAGVSVAAAAASTAAAADRSLLAPRRLAAAAAAAGGGGSGGAAAGTSAAAPGQAAANVQPGVVDYRERLLTHRFLYINAAHARQWFGTANSKSDIPVVIELDGRVQSPTFYVRATLHFYKNFTIAGSDLHRAAAGKWFLGWSRPSPDGPLHLLLRTATQHEVAAAKEKERRKEQSRQQKRRRTGGAEGAVEGGGAVTGTPEPGAGERGVMRDGVAEEGEGEGEQEGHERRRKRSRNAEL
ncbi:hypothetical protein Agub_g5833 [Astrephomene gubernaculifera]|uniref:U-box domain-containing protein n=1 Tax=Astrephomene gubernaculifera TaxID=47775 RepID=A0AAD3DQ24_9CHLO|nr:hypothetical protein Agub_g5833 [Astrephomene gubernaculifera]